MFLKKGGGEWRGPSLAFNHTKQALKTICSEIPLIRAYPPGNALI